MIDFRTIDGSANNPNDLGEAGASLRRILSPAYESDGVNNDLPRGIEEQEPGNPFIGPSNLPNPREISNVVSNQTESVTNYLDASDWIWQWGQFLDHDLDLNEGANEPFFIPVDPNDPIADGLRRFLPEESNQTQLLLMVDPENLEESGLVLPLLDGTGSEESISLDELTTIAPDFVATDEFVSELEDDLSIQAADEPEVEVEISEEGIPFIPFTRIADANESEPLRQYINEITAFIDGSQVYGSEEERAEFIRANDGTGKLKSQIVNGEELLPLNTAGLENANPFPPEVLPDESLFVAGDVRANEQIGLTAAHTLFLREHNRIAEEIGSRIEQGDESIINLQEESGLETGDFIYEATRKVVGAEIQFITYNEYLPILLGDSLLEDYSGYDPDVNPNISIEFANVSFRLGHSQLSNEIKRVNSDGITEESIALRNAFFDPQEIKNDGVDSLLLGLPTQVAQEVDNLIVDGVRNFLFGAGTGGFDLAAVNIQRGRDVGLPSYNDARRGLGLTPATSFLTTDGEQGITSNPEIAARFAEIYESIEDVDFWIGGISEDPVNNGLVGELFSVVLTEQFKNLRDGDRFFYLNDDSDLAVLAPDLEDTTLAKIIQENTLGDVVIQENAFLVPDLSIEAVESENNANSLDFTVSLSDVSGAVVTVNYETVDGVGTAGEDYVNNQGTLTFAPGEQTKTISVELLNDAVLQDNETFFLRLSNPSNQNIDGNLAVSQPKIDRKISGNNSNNILNGGFSNDSIEGNSGNDTISGGLGNDLLKGDDGNDLLNGEFRNSRQLDRVFARNVPGFSSTTNNSVSINNSSSNFNLGNTGGFFSNNDTQIGGNGNDTLNGGFGSDTQLGGDGNDILNGDLNFNSQFNSPSSFNLFNGNDVQIGGNGNDELNSGAGEDKLNGTGDRFGAGEIDQITGGSGKDIFVVGDRQDAFYSSQKDLDYALITDFDIDRDTIELHGEITDYAIAPTAGDLPQGTGLYLDVDSSGDISDTDELIIISTQTFSSLDKGFSFV